MAHAEVHAPSEDTIQIRPKLLYGLNDRPPFKDALFVGFQHVCAIFIPVVTPAQNNGIIQLTGVGSRYAGYFISAILIILGLFPLVGGVLLAIPTSVFGGAVMLMFGTVAVAGFNILREVKMDNRSFVILAISLAAGLGVTFIPEALHHFPPAVQSVLESGIATGSIFALVLNLIVPKPSEALDSIPVQATEATSVSTEVE